MGADIAVVVSYRTHIQPDDLRTLLDCWLTEIGATKLRVGVNLSARGYKTIALVEFGRQNDPVKLSLPDFVFKETQIRLYAVLKTIPDQAELTYQLTHCARWSEYVLSPSKVEAVTIDPPRVPSPIDSTAIITQGQVRPTTLRPTVFEPSKEVQPTVLKRSTRLKPSRKTVQGEIVPPSISEPSKEIVPPSISEPSKEIVQGEIEPSKEIVQGEIVPPSISEPSKEIDSTPFCQSVILDRLRAQIDSGLGNELGSQELGAVILQSFDDVEILYNVMRDFAITQDNLQIKLVEQRAAQIAKSRQLQTKVETLCSIVGQALDVQSKLCTTILKDRSALSDIIIAESKVNDQRYEQHLKTQADLLVRVKALEAKLIDVESERRYREATLALTDRIGPLITEHAGPMLELLRGLR